MKFASKTRGRERAPNSVVLFASIYKRKNSFIIHFLLFINKKAGFGNQQNKFETTKRLRGGTPLNACLYRKGATIVAPRYHNSRTKFGRQGLRLCVQAATCRQGLRLCCLFLDFLVEGSALERRIVLHLFDFLAVGFARVARSHIARGRLAFFACFSAFDDNDFSGHKLTFSV